MARLVVADTDAVIDFFTDSPPLSRVLAGLLQEGRLAVTAVTVFELYAEVRGAKRLKQLEAFFDRVPVLTLGLLAAAYAGKVYNDLKSQGKTIGNQDILVAGICLANGLPLITRNGAHFTPIKDLTLFS